MNIDYILDIETTIPADTIRIGGVYSLKHRLATCFINLSELLEALKPIPPGSTLCTWNGSRFDLPKIKEIWGFDLELYLREKEIKHIDGLLLSKMLFPEEYDHSLLVKSKKYFPSDPDKWKDPVPKDEQGKKDFYNLTPTGKLSAYLNTDLFVTGCVMERMVTSTAFQHPNAQWEHPLRVEQAVAEIVQRQVDRGVEFDYWQANDLYEGIYEKKQSLERALVAHLPVLPIPEDKQDHPPSKQFKKDGTPTVAIEKYCARYGYTVEERSTGWFAEGKIFSEKLPLVKPFVTTEQLHPSKSMQLKDYLLSIGWKPTWWNTKRDKVTGKTIRTSPRLSEKQTKEPCPNLVKIGVAWVPLLTEWLTLRSRLNILQGEKGDTGWMVKCKSTDLGVGTGYTLPSDADTCGTPTARFRHKGIVNVPRTSSFLGREMRSLFVPREGKKMVGWDAEGLEARMEAHYVHPFDPDYAKTLVEGNSEDGTDIHTLNWKRLGLRDRDAAKTFKYAITYGAKASKLAESLDVPFDVASDWFDAFWDTNQGLEDLVLGLNSEWVSFDNKYLQGLDGRLLTTRSQHSLLNTKLQGAGAVVMKHAFIIADALIHEKFPSEMAAGLIRMHDEEQWEADECIAEEVGRIGASSIVKAGEYFKLNVPLAASFKTGDSWADTH
jgi:hypothetical protein